MRLELLADIRKSGVLRAAKPRARWAVADRYAGIEHAQLVVVNVRHDSDRAAAEQMAADVNRIRKDEVGLHDEEATQAQPNRSSASRGRREAVRARGDQSTP